MHDRVPRQQTSPISARIAPVLLVLTVAAGTLLRLLLLTRRNLWVDEAASVILAQLPWRNFSRALWNYEANMSFYYLLLRGWLHLGDSETAVRGLSVLFGVAVIPATYLLGKRLFGRKAAIASAALSAVNIFQIRYSQEARGYSLVMLLVVLSTYFFLRAMESPGQKRYWVGYVFISALAVYSHVYVYLVVLAQWLSLGYPRLRLLGRRTVSWTVAGFILLTIPMNAFLLLKNQGQLNWVPRPTAELLLNFADFFTGNGGITLLVVYAALCLAAVFWSPAAERHRSPGFDERWRVRLVAWWLGFPIAATLLVSLFRPVFYDRFMTICAPALVLLAGQGMAKLDQVSVRLRGVFPALLIMVLGMSVWGIHRYNKSPSAQGDDWRLATRYILAGQQPGDAAFFYRASGSRPFTYYVHRETEEHGVTLSPSVVFPLDVGNPQDFNVEPNQEQAKLAIGGRKRIWLILQHYEGVRAREAALEAIQAALQEENCRLSQDQVFPGTSGTIRVQLYVRAPVLDSQTTYRELPFGMRARIEQRGEPAAGSSCRRFARQCQCGEFRTCETSFGIGGRLFRPELRRDDRRDNQRDEHRVERAISGNLRGCACFLRSSLRTYGHAVYPGSSRS
jgi:mannosyltransferase